MGNGGGGAASGADRASAAEAFSDAIGAFADSDASGDRPSARRGVRPNSKGIEKPRRRRKSKGSADQVAQTSDDTADDKKTTKVRSSRRSKSNRGRARNGSNETGIVKRSPRRKSKKPRVNR
jgi:hypothetical protein